MSLAIILLAAGDSRRFGANKLLHEFHGKPMYRYVTDEIRRLPDGLFDRKLVVTQYEEIGTALEQEGFEAVENHESSLGISHSIHLALERADCDAYCFAVCDQPYLRAETIEGLVGGFLNSKKGIGCLCNMGELGNPAVFSRRYRQELMELKGDVGGKRIIRRHIDDLYLYEVTDGLELVDIDIQAYDPQSEGSVS